MDYNKCKWYIFTNGKIYKQGIDKVDPNNLDFSADKIGLIIYNKNSDKIIFDIPEGCVPFYFARRFFENNIYLGSNYFVGYRNNIQKVYKVYDSVNDKISDVIIKDVNEEI